MNLLVIAMKLVSNREKDMGALVVWYSIFGSCALGLAIATVAAKIKLDFIRYVSVFSVFVRIAVTFWLLHQASAGASGFE